MNVAIVFHDPLPFVGTRLRDRLRSKVQTSVMLRSAVLADKVISTISPERVPWMQADSIRAKVSLLQVGSMLAASSASPIELSNNLPTVVVFGVTGHNRDEATLIATVVGRAAERCGRTRLVVFGRGAKFVEKTLIQSLQSSNVDLDVYDILDATAASELLANSNVQLFVRSGLSSRRSSAIAGITCGLPVVGFRGAETAFPITEAGVRLVPFGDVDGLVRELTSVLQDKALQENLRAASRSATEKYFSWDRIADAYLTFLTPN